MDKFASELRIMIFNQVSEYDFPNLMKALRGNPVIYGEALAISYDKIPLDGTSENSLMRLAIQEHVYRKITHIQVRKVPQNVEHFSVLNSS